MIKNLLALSAFLVLVFAVVGWYLNWYRIETKTTEDGRRSIHIDLNSPKISDDLQEGKKNLHKILASDEDQNQKQPAAQTPNTSPPKTNEQTGNFWFDGESEFVFPPAPNVQQPNRTRPNAPPTNSGIAPASYPPLPPAPTVPPPGFPIR